MHSQERHFPEGTPLSARIATTAFLAAWAAPEQRTDDIKQPTVTRQRRHHRLLALACAGVLAGPLQACSGCDREREKVVQVVKGEDGEISIFRDNTGSFVVEGIEGKYAHVGTKIINGKTVVFARLLDGVWKVFDLNKKTLASGNEINIITLNGKQFFHVNNTVWKVVDCDGKIVKTFTIQGAQDDTASVVAEMLNKMAAGFTISRSGKQFLYDDKGKRIWIDTIISKVSFDGKDYIRVNREEGLVTAMADEQGRLLTPWYKALGKITLYGDDLLFVQLENDNWQLRGFPSDRPITGEYADIEIRRFRGRDVLRVIHADGYIQVLDKNGQALTKRYKEIPFLAAEGNILAVRLENGHDQLLRSSEIPLAETPITGEFVTADAVETEVGIVFILTLQNGWKTVITDKETRPIQPKPDVRIETSNDSSVIWVKHPDGREQLLSLSDGKPVTKAYRQLENNSWWWGWRDDDNLEIADDLELRNSLNQVLERLHMSVINVNSVGAIEDLLQDEKKKAIFFNERPDDGIQYFCGVMQWASIPVEIIDLPAMVDFLEKHAATEVETAAKAGRLNGKRSVSEALQVLSETVQ